LACNSFLFFDLAPLPQAKVVIPKGLSLKSSKQRT
jgi:hypothetical protein